MLTTAQVTTWVEAYVGAWRSYRRDEIEALFAEQAESHEWPHRASWIGRDAIVAGWEERRQGQQQEWRFDWSILAINGDTAAIEATAAYEQLGTFANLWTLTLDDDGRCLVLRLWINWA